MLRLTADDAYRGRRQSCLHFAVRLPAEMGKNATLYANYEISTACAAVFTSIMPLKYSTVLLIYMKEVFGETARVISGTGPCRYCRRRVGYLS